MSLLDMLKSLLGRGSSRERRSRQRDVGVTVEHEPGEPETATEQAVKGTDLGTGTPSRSPSGHEDERDSSTGSGAVEIPDAEELASDSETEQPDEPVEIPDAEELEGVDGGEAGTEPAETEPSGGGSDVEPESAGEPTNVIKGIGDTYAERLAEAGVETVGDLAAADPADLAERADVSESRLERWVERARDR